MSEWMRAFAMPPGCMVLAQGEAMKQFWFVASWTVEFRLGSGS
jgi:hypothetical protein